MSSKNSSKLNVPEAKAAMDKFKMEAASGQEDDRVLREEPVTSPTEGASGLWPDAPFRLPASLPRTARLFGEYLPQAPLPCIPAQTNGRAEEVFGKITGRRDWLTSSLRFSGLLAVSNT